MSDNRYYKSLIGLIASCAVFGTIGVFKKNIPIDSGLIAMIRGFLGGMFLIAFLAIKKRPFSFAHFTKRNLILLILTGALMGFNWMLLFEAYEYTTVATATLCYYMQPIFLIIISAGFFSEKIGPARLLCVVLAFAGMIMVSGVPESGFEIAGRGATGVLFGLLSGLMYAIIVTLNKTITGCDPYEKTAIQLLSAGVSIIPYLTAKGVFADPNLIQGFTGTVIVLLLILGIFHTGIIYAVYFSAVENLSMLQTAVFGYVDPVVAVMLSYLILKEKLSVYGIIGAVLIIAAAMGSELFKD